MVCFHYLLDNSVRIYNFQTGEYLNNIRYHNMPLFLSDFMERSILTLKGRPHLVYYAHNKNRMWYSTYILDLISRSKPAIIPTYSNLKFKGKFDDYALEIQQVNGSEYYYIVQINGMVILKNHFLENPIRRIQLSEQILKFTYRAHKGQMVLLLRSPDAPSYQLMTLDWSSAYAALSQGFKS